MDVNNRILLNNKTDKSLTIPIDITWDFTGQDQLIELYEDEITKDITGEGVDFEVERFPHDIIAETNKTELNYEFYFYSGGSINSPSSWNNSYLTEGISIRNIYYSEEKFTKSFFKLDFYDTVDEKRQNNNITVIIPTTQGHKTQILFNKTDVNIRIPKFTLDYVGDVEGFFIYWLKKIDFLNINTFYMTAKFYNAATGTFVKMMNTPQGVLPVGTEYTFDPIKYFYYRVVLDYNKKSYRVFRFDPVTNTTIRVGSKLTPITWYEYVNP